MDSGGSEIDHPPLLDHDGQGVGRQGHRWSRGRPTGSQGVKVWAYRVPGGQQGGLMGLATGCDDS